MKFMKVVLVNPLTMDPSSSPSLGLAYIAHAVEQAGFSTHIIDANSRLGGYTIAKLRREVEALQPDVLGFSFCTASIPLVYKQIDALKGLAKLTIAGGPHPTDVPCEVLDNGVDVVVVGEGEKTVVDLLDNWESGGDWKSIDGIGFKQGEDIIINPDRPLIENIDDATGVLADLTVERTFEATTAELTALNYYTDGEGDAIQNHTYQKQAACQVSLFVTVIPEGSGTCADSPDTAYSVLLDGTYSCPDLKAGNDYHMLIEQGAFYCEVAQVDACPPGGGGGGGGLPPIPE